MFMIESSDEAIPHILIDFRDEDEVWILYFIDSLLFTLLFDKEGLSWDKN